MASPFENLLQAAQFAVQTRANYDQMAERRRENTMSLMQRRSEQEQQNQQFLSEMNLKDRQQRMQADQFNRTINQTWNIAQMQDARAAQTYELQKRIQEFQMGPQFEAEQAYRKQSLAQSGFANTLAGRRLAMEEADFGIRMAEAQRAQAAREAGPISIDIDPATNLAKDYESIQGLGDFGAGIISAFLPSKLAGRLFGYPSDKLPDVKGSVPIFDKKYLREGTAGLTSEDIVKLSKDVDAKIAESIRTGRALDQNSLLQAYLVMQQGYDVASKDMSKAEKARVDFALRKMQSYLPREVFAQPTPQQ